MSNNTGTENARVHWTGSKNHSCLKNGATKISCVLDKGYSSIELGLEGPYTSWWHMFGWNTFGILLFGPAVATYRFFKTLNRIEAELNRQSSLK